MTSARRTNILANATPYLFGVLIAVCTYRMLMICLRQDLAALVDTSYDVTVGKPIWLAYQNRLLGPYAILLISAVGLSYKIAWKLFIAGTLLIESLLLIHLFKRDGQTSTGAIVNLVLFMFGVVLMQNHLFQSWDGVDLIVFALFAYAVLNRFPAIFYVVLFGFELLNRESALFISIFLILDGFRLSVVPFSIKLADKRRVFLGGVLTVAGAAYTKLIRDALFVSRTSGQPDTSHAVVGNHTEYLLYNLQCLFLPNPGNTLWIFSAAVLLATGFFAVKHRMFGDAELKCFVMFVVLLMGILSFGVFVETRMLSILLPFGFLLWLRVEALEAARVPKPR